jgi:cysteine desulfurase
MSQALLSNPGNPSALHFFGRESRRSIENARTQVAKLVSCSDDEIIFTSGATEANNLALFGLAGATPPEKTKILVSPIEHPAVIEPCQRLAQSGFEISWLPVDRAGVLDIGAAADLLAPDVAFSTLMWVNNETGATQPVEEWAQLCRQAGVPFHCDAAQAVGRIPVDLTKVHATALTMSAHKFHGPLGSGALYLRRDTAFHPTLIGGGQEREKRAGTEHVVGALGLAASLLFAVEEMDTRTKAIEKLSFDILEGLKTANVHFEENVSAHLRWPGTLNIRVDGHQAEALLMNLDLKGIAVSVGSACSSGSLEPSSVLQAMGLSVEHNLSSIRVSVAHTNTNSDVQGFVQALTEIQNTNR